MLWSPTRTQSQTLLRMIALGIEQRLRLAPLLRAFAEDQSGDQRWRVNRVAELLEGGSSLPDALEQVPRVLPEGEVLAIRFGTQSGTLPITLRRLIEDSKDARAPHGLRNSLLYAAGVTPVILGILTFLMVKIVPAHLKIMDDYGVGSPVLRWEVDVSRFLVNYWWAFVAAGLLLAWILWTRRPGRSLRRGLARLWCDAATADVLQSLSVVLEAGRPIPGALSTLARYHHDPTLRQKLLFVRNEVEQGADPWDALQKTKLLDPDEIALMEASEKVGNRPWAMAQLANCKRRRMRRRLEWAGQMAHPATILLLGAVVLTMSLGVLSPLVNILFSLM